MRETPQAAQAFEDYYDLGDDRSIRKLAESNQKYIKSVSKLLKWSTEHGWQERVKVRDRERAEAKRKKHDAEIEEMNKRHTQIGTSLQLKGIKRADSLLQKEEVTASEALRMIKLGADLERVARGEPTEISQVNGDKEERDAISLPIGDLTMDEVNDLKRIAQSIRERKQKAEDAS